MSSHRPSSTADGSGAILGVAAAEQLAASHVSETEPYGFATQHMTLFSYHLLRHGGLLGDRLIADLVGTPEPGSLVPFRMVPDWFRELVLGPEPATSDEPCSDPAIRMVPLAVWHRWDADRLASDGLEAIATTHTDRRGTIAASAYAGAVAAASFGQLGLDLLSAARSMADRAQDLGSRSDQLTGEPDPGSASLFRNEWLTESPATVYQTALRQDPALGVIGAAIALGAHGNERSSDILRACAALDPWLAALVGGIAGARQGLGRWQWPVTNETWFTEIGLRIAAHRADLDNLPDPHSVEVSLGIEGDGGSHRVF